MVTTKLRFCIFLYSKEFSKFVHSFHDLLGNIFSRWNGELNHGKYLINILGEGSQKLSCLPSLVRHIHNCDYKENYEKGKYKN